MDKNFCVMCISGKAEAGKDLLASKFKEVAESNDKKVCVMHYGDYLKDIASRFYGWDGNKDEKGRTLLQWLGSDVARKENPNIWVNVIAETIAALKKEFDYFLIPDTRFPNEVDIINDSFDRAFSVRINRPDHKSKLTDEQLLHISEIALDDFEFDFNLSATNETEIIDLAEGLFGNLDL